MISQCNNKKDTKVIFSRNYGGGGGCNFFAVGDCHGCMRVLPLITVKAPHPKVGDREILGSRSTF